MKEYETDEYVVIWENGEALFGYKFERAMDFLKRGLARKVLLVKKIWANDDEIKQSESIWT